MDDLNYQAEVLAQKVKHLIITNSGHTTQDASPREFYVAFCAMLQEEISINWTATIDTLVAKKVRTAHLISMEYLPGRRFSHNICNMGAKELIKAVLAKLNRNFNDIAICENEASLGNGGLGRLSSCFLDSLATLQYPAYGYGLRYQYGIFEQEIWEGVQVERPDCWLLHVNPWEKRRDVHAVSVYYGGRPIEACNTRGDDVQLLQDYEEVRAIPYDVPIIGYEQPPNFSVLLLRLWSTKESPRNFELQRYNAGFLEQAAENTCLTDVLYPNDNHELGKRIRLKQEFLLVSASLKDIIRRHLKIFGNLTQFADKVRIQINDTHPTLIIAELMRTLTKNHNFSWENAWETCQTCCSYTNHTILKEALEAWNEIRVATLLPRQYKIIQKLNYDFCTQVRKKWPGDEELIRRISIIENGQIRMAHLAILGSHKINGVSKLHGKILKTETFKDFCMLFPEKFTYVTNGMTQRRWLLNANPDLAAFLTKKIGPAWITDFPQIEKLKPFASDPKSQLEFLSIKKKNKQNLLSYLSEQNPIRDHFGHIISHSPILGTDALFDVHIKRFHEYKRQLMNILHLIMISQELLSVPSQKRAVHRFAIFSGKAAPGYVKAKQILNLLCAVAHKFQAHPEIRDYLTIVFVENYNVSKAEIIIPAADLSEQISTAGWEASGTGNMKLAINGALTMGTEDGANIEMREAITDRWWPFGFGSSAKENQLPYNPSDIYLNDEPIQRAVDTLKNGTFARNPSESDAFTDLYQYLVESDPFRILKDLRSYYETQKKAEALFLQPNLWAEIAINNIAAMGPFSTDVSIRNYAEKIWDIQPCPPDLKILEKVTQEYSEHDACRVRVQQLKKI